MSSEEKKVNENAAAEEAEKVEVNAEQVEDAVKEEKETEKTDKNEKAEKKGFFKNKNKEVEELGQKLADMQDKFQRTLAEFDNFRKRTSKEKASMYDDGVRDTIEKLLPIFDNLESYRLPFIDIIFVFNIFCYVQLYRYAFCAFVIIFYMSLWFF